MKIVNGAIEPGIRIGDFWIGSKKEDVIDKLCDGYKVWQRGDGFCVYTLDNFKLWFGINGELEQIGVTKGFCGNYQSVCIGSTLQDVMINFGEYENDGDVYMIPNLNGICFELEDVEDWNELTSPIEWIFVYKC